MNIVQVVHHPAHSLLAADGAETSKLKQKHWKTTCDQLLKDECDSMCVSLKPFKIIFMQWFCLLLNASWWMNESGKDCCFF